MKQAQHPPVHTREIVKQAQHTPPVYTREIVKQEQEKRKISFSLYLCLCLRLRLLHMCEPDLTLLNIPHRAGRLIDPYIIYLLLIII